MPKSPKKLAVGLLFDDTLDSSDGVAQQVKRLGEWLGTHGHKVVYLCGQTEMAEWSGGKVYSLSRNIKVKFNGNRLSMPLWPRISAINKVLREEKLDVIHVQTPYSPLMAQAVISRACRNSAIVATVHIVPAGLVAGFGAWLLRIVQWRSLKKLNLVISVSTAAAGFAKRYLGLDSTVIPNMVDLSALTASARIDQSQRIVFLGRLVPRKGCKQLIAAFAQLSKTHPQAELVIAGDGAQRHQLEEMSAHLGLTGKVRFLGFIREEDKANLLASAAIACFPALYGESFGVVLIEAMAAGSGVVLAGDNPGYASVMKDQPTLLVNPKDKREFSHRLAQLLDDRELVAKLRSWQKVYVKQFDTNAAAPQVLAVYESAIAKKTKAGDN